MTTPNADRTGILLMLAAVFMFSIMDMLAKHLSTQFETPQIVWARYAGQVLFTLLWLRGRAVSLLRTRHLGMQIMRSVFLFAATFCFFTALSFMEMASATAVMNIHPVLVTLGAALFLGERLGPRRVFGVLAALAGALIIIRPGADVFSLAALLPLLGGALYASYALTTRMLGRDEDILTSFLYTALVGSAVATMLALPVWHMPNLQQAAMFLAIGGAGALGQFLLIRSLNVAEAGIVAPFGYAGVVYATVWGVVIFAEVPDVWTLAGASLIVVAGLYVWYRDARAKGASADG